MTTDRTIQTASDRDAIVDVTTRLGWYADQRRWDELLGLFAGQVTLDYTSLAGGEPVTVSPADIVASWKGGLGGLDATQHVVSNHLVDLDGDTAVATAQFIAIHRLDNPHGDPLWTLGGHYRWTLARHQGRWRITTMTMTATWATGNRHIMTLAAAPPETAGQLARRFLAGLEAMDIDAALSVFAVHAAQEMPFSPAGFPRRLEGIDALRTQYGGLPGAYRSMRFHVDDVIETGSTATVRYRGEIELAGGGRYDNTYIGVFETSNGRIDRFIEYFDPTVLAAAFDTSAMTDTFNLEGDGP